MATRLRPHEENRIMREISKSQVIPFPVDLGTVVVPQDYDPRTCLARHHSLFKARSYVYSKHFSDENFRHPSNIIQPGWKLHTWSIPLRGNKMTSEECLEYLSEQNSLLLGAQGLALVMEQKLDYLTPEVAHIAFDREEYLGKSGCGDRGVPSISIQPDFFDTPPRSREEFFTKQGVTEDDYQRYLDTFKPITVSVGSFEMFWRNARLICYERI